ncbi:putative ATP-binding cassette transporter [Rhodoblastus acidophilus]|uniref:Putative ATP-binding cassette transporter n=1 Tax=Rhodoblastus acidophilus TaxID=1074 RepID=A0A212RCN8_RHOAC|nr:ABC transporter ATP-binding protein/permease [Rhodoblastus acidophilus]PPQ39470.1 glycosyl transferase family 1 [Rhodoblastus acidophilus]RAI18600.1 glycosyl transferase family 1 [Rhodoblastus acidophilus]SNB69980.1 putative ATP-binding cassette transporter [Rhodoblastus acidophilus]
MAGPIEAADEDFVALGRGLLRALSASAQRRVLAALAAGLCVVVGGGAWMQIRLNAWTKAFYDSLAERNLDAFFHQLFLYLFIAGTLLALNVAQKRLNLTMKMVLREGLTRDLIAQWLAPGRAFRIGAAGAIGVNPDQRVHEDANHLADLSTELGVGLLQSALLLACFIGVLWRLSENVVLSFRGQHFSIPGYMVWAALIYAGAASFLSWRAARKLVPLTAERYARESDLRFALVHASDHGEGIAVHRGEAEERGKLNARFDRLLAVLRRLIGVTTRLTWVTAGSGWIMLAAPTLVASPAYFAGDLSFGGLLMAVGAFEQVNQSLRWFVDNSSAIADWRATLLRVGGFRRALEDLDRFGGPCRIDRAVAPDNVLRLDDLAVASPAGRIRLDAAHVEIAPGQHTLIVGAPGAGKTSLFRALAGLWIWGDGRIGLPADDRMMFMPKRAYIPDGRLRDVLAYPGAADALDPALFAQALARMGLSHLAGRLDETARWDQELSEAEQQGLAFARLLLHRPLWVVVDSAIDSLSAAARKALLDLFGAELSGSTLVYIAGPQGDDPFFGRVLHLAPQETCPAVSLSSQQLPR